MKKKKICRLLTLVVLVMAMMLMASCGSAKTDEDLSPRLDDIRLDSYNENSIDSQWVTVDLIFDRPIAVEDDKCENLRITIAGERVQDNEYTLIAGDQDNIARLKISVEAITKGVLKIEKEKADKAIDGIRSIDGKYAVWDFTVEALIPSGVTLSTVESGAGKVVKSVDSYWNIRSIAWVGLTENGEVVPVSETRELENLDGYAAVHGHEFLTENERDIAASIVETLKNNYGPEYSFSCDGNKITVTKAGSDVDLDIDIYSYKKVN